MGPVLLVQAILVCCCYMFLAGGHLPETEHMNLSAKSQLKGRIAANHVAYVEAHWQN
jgi:hypothetical protein